MAFSSAFQRNAFQNNAFQIATGHIGARIVGGQFSRGQWRDLKEKIATQARAIERQRRELEERRLAAERREAERLRAETEARRLAEDELSRILADHAAMQAAQRALMGAQSAITVNPALIEAAYRAHALAQDEDEAIALLMLSDVG